MAQHLPDVPSRPTVDQLRAELYRMMLLSTRQHVDEGSQQRALHRCVQQLHADQRLAEAEHARLRSAHALHTLKTHTGYRVLMLALLGGSFGGALALQLWWWGGSVPVAALLLLLVCWCAFVLYWLWMVETYVTEHYDGRRPVGEEFGVGRMLVTVAALCVCAALTVGSFYWAVTWWWGGGMEQDGVADGFDE